MLALANSFKEILFVVFLVLVPTVPVTIAVAAVLRARRHEADLTRGTSEATPFRLIGIVGVAATLAVLGALLIVIGARAIADSSEGESVEPVVDGGRAAAELPRVPAQGNAAVGARVFARSGCGDCHTLLAAKATGTRGTNLDESNPGFTAVVECVTTGPGDMPSFAGRLSGSEIRDVAKYVATVTPQ
jgi:mono/diheme cytochrome c family protein